MNDMRNLKTAVDQTVKLGQHAQGTISYTVSPVHTLQTWVDMAKAIEDMGAHSLCIKDMAGLLLYQGHFARAIGFPYWSTYRQALVIIKFWSLRL
jgi:pyruvate/oxaloacetate carboxyltransferase